jgi:hypothetical protein
MLRAGWDLPDVVELLGPERGGPAVRRSRELGCGVVQRLRDLLQT